MRRKTLFAKGLLFLGGCTTAVIVALLAFQVAPTIVKAAGFVGKNKTYTTDADFDMGVLFNVNHNAPNNNQLQLSAERTTFPVMWIANAGEDTVSKIDTNTGRELGRYRTGFGPAGQAGHQPHLGNAYGGPAPSRTGVDTEGNLFIANRRFDGRIPDVLKIAGEGGVDRNGNGVIDTSSDLDNNGVISGAEIKPMADTNGDGVIQIAEVQDERVIWVARVGGSGGPANGLGRSLCLDTNGDVWVGMYNSRQYWKLDRNTGNTLVGPISTGTHTPYGCLVDASGILWGASLSTTLLKLDTNTNTVLNVFSHASFGSDYGITLGNGRVYQANYSGQTYTDFNPATNTFSAPSAVKFTAYGIATDSAGNIVAGNVNSGGATKFTPAGAVLWSAPPQPGTGEVRGVQVDSNNDVWLIHLTSANVSKYRGTNGAPLGVFPVGNMPYTYSDATGISGFTTTNPTGRWTVVQDSGAAGNPWDKIAWNAEPQGAVPPGTSLVVEARVADVEANLGAQPFAPITNGGALTLTGRFIEVRVTFSSNSPTTSPILSDLSITSKAAFLACDGDRDGDVDSADLMLIRLAYNQTVAPGTDPRDGNGDGIINIADSRFCALRCTRPSCAVGAPAQ